jgi:hypothetical protein
MKKHILLIFVMLCAFGIRAQVTTASLTGTVSNGSKTVDNASIQVLLTTTNAQYNTVSRTDGSYDIFNMTAGGPYTVVFTASGLQSVTIENVYLTLGENYNLDVDFSLNVSKIDAVIISRSKLNSGTKTGSATNINAQTLNNLPTINRSLSDFTRLTPQAGGNSSFNGRDGRMNNITIDGANFNNNFGLSTNNMPGGDAQPISLDALEAVQVNVTPFDVRQSNFTGAGVNAITKSGSNNLSASVYSYFRNEKMNGTKVGATELTNIPQSSSQILGFRVGGAIKKDKVFYFASFESENKSYPGLSYYPTKAGVAPNAGDPNQSRVLESDLLAVQKHLKDKYNYETGDFTNLGNFATQNVKFLGRLDWNINAKHKFSARYNYVQNTNDQILNGTSAPNPRSASNRWSANAMSFANSNYSFLNTVGSLSLELKSNLNARMSNQLLVTGTMVEDTRKTGSSPFPFVDIKKGGDQYISFGYELFSYNNNVVNNTYSFIDNFTYNLNNQHTITAGIAYDQMYVGNSFLRYGTSYYRYDSLSQFLNDKAPSAYAVTYGYNGNKNPIAELGFGQLAAYVQDEYRVNKNLKVVAGVRVDQPIYLTTPLANIGFDTSRVLSKLSNPEGAAVDYDPSTWPNAGPLFSPRVGFNYDLKGNKSLVIRGGTGVFTGRLPFVWYTNQPTNAYGLQATVEYTAAADLNKYQITQFNPDVNAYVANLPQQAGKLPSGASFALVDKSFNFPQVWRTSLGIDAKLPLGIEMTTDVIFSKSLNDIYQYDANMRPSDTVYFAGTDFERAAFKKSASRKYVSTVNNAMVLSNTGEGFGMSVAVTLSKNFKNGFSAALSYSYNNTMDITANPGSQASSAWSNNTTAPTAIGQNQNTPALSYSQYSTPNRLVGSVAYKFEYLKNFATTISLVYEGYNQGRYNYVYSSDINNDGLTGNDMIFVHKSADIKFAELKSGTTVIATADEQAKAWDAFVAQDAYLSANVGKFTERFAATMPWLNQFDLAINQDIMKNIGKNNHKLQLSLNIINVGNLINSEWGVRQQLTVSNGAVLKYNNATNTYNFNAVNGKLPTSTYTNILNTTNVWGMQIGARYTF